MKWVFFLPIEITGVLFWYETGIFMVIANKGNTYTIVVYDFDSKTINEELINSRGNMHF